jgi:WD40 repeat protein/serine/threonine protein kinase
MTCLKCGAPLAIGTSQWFCPKCLFIQANAGTLQPASLPGDDDTALISSPIGEELPRSFGDYELLEHVARGGMGIVYKARQVSLDRIVAVKMLLFGPLASPEFVKRFRAEASAAASLVHPNIVAIHEVGVHQGQHYFAMDYVGGQSLAALLASGPLPATRAALYLKTIAQAIHYAHERGILHRDLKPSNVLIDGNDRPHVTDFGLARRLEGDSELTMTGQVLGSPNYMPPEQVVGRRGKVSRRTDVYSLGAMLYHLLTGRPPFVGEGVTDILEQVLNAEAVSPRVLNPSVPRDLETICLKCIQKEPDKRYPTAEALADELNRFLKTEPVHARPVTRTERCWRWCRRKPALASFIAATALLFLAILVGSPVAITQIANERAQAQANLIRQYVATGNRFGEQGNFMDALPWFAEALRLEHEPARIAIIRLRLAMFMAECPIPQRIWSHSGQVLAAEFSPDGNKVAVGTSDGTVTVWNLQDGNHHVVFKHGQRIELVKFSPNGRQILTTARGGNEILPDPQTDAESTVRLWDVTSGTMLVELPHASRVTAACFSGDGAHVATASRQDGVKVWQVDSGAQVLAVPGTTNAVDVVWNPDNQALFACQTDGSISRRELGSGRISWSGKHTNAAHMTVSNSGELLLSFGDASTIEVRKALTGELMLQLGGGVYSWNGSNIGFNHAEFSPDDQQLLGVRRDGATTIWAVNDGRGVTRIREIQHTSFGVFDLTARFDRDGRRVITGNNAGARVWDAVTGIALSPPLSAFTRVQVAKFSPGAEHLLTAGADSVCRLWTSGTIARNRSVLPWKVPVDACAFSPDGQRVALAGGGAAALWSVAGKRLSADLMQNKGDTDNDFVEFSADGRKLVSTGRGEAIVWDVTSGKPLFPPFQHSTNGDLIARFAPNGRQIVTFGVDCAVRFWNVETGEEEALPRPIQNRGAFNGLSFVVFNGVQFSPDGTLLLTAGGGRVAQLWSLKSGEPVGPSVLHSAPIQSAAFNHNGHFAVTADQDGLARVWRVPSGLDVCPPLKHFGYVSKAIFSRDGSRLLTASGDRLATIWDIPSGRARLRLLHGDYVNDAAFSPDERLIATASEQGLRLWDARTGEPISSYIPLSVKNAQAWRVRFSPDGRLVLACSQYARNAMLYRLPRDTHLGAAWLDLAAIISGQRVLSDGRLESLTPSELAAAWDRAQLSPMPKSFSE